MLSTHKDSHKHRADYTSGVSLFSVRCERAWLTLLSLWMCLWVCSLIGCQDPPRAYNDRVGGLSLDPYPTAGEAGGVRSGGEQTTSGERSGETAGGSAGESAGESAGGLAGEISEDMSPPLDAAAFDPIPFAVETRVGERNTEAGLENRVTCQLLDQEAQPISAPNLRVEVVPSQGFSRSEQGVIGEVARSYELTCIAAEYGLIDSTPALWTVTPSQPALSIARLSQDGAPVERIRAGERVEVTCQAFDAYGNPSDATFTEQIEPSSLGVERVGPTWRFDRAGQYQVTCEAPGVEETRPALLEVSAELPRRVTLDLEPDLPVYQAGQVVRLIPRAFDARDNPVSEVSFQLASDPELPSFGAERLLLNTLGRFSLSAEVTSQTDGDRELIATREVVVDFGGPGIRCFEPEVGEVVIAGDGDAVNLIGQATDLTGVRSLTVDGVEVPFDADGRFQTQVTARWGLNIHEVVAADDQGESSAFCAYFASPRFIPEGQPLLDALLLFLGSDVVDDGPPDRPLNSVGDVLRRVVNSAGLRDSVHAATSAQNPIVPTECRARVLGICVFRFGVNYEDFRISRANDLSLTLLDNALRVRITLRDIAVVARLRGTLGNRAEVTTSGITVDLTFNAGLGAGGRPNISVRSINEVTVNRLDSDFSGLITGFILELAFSAFEGLIRDTVTDAIRGFLERELDSTLTGLFSDTSVGDLGGGFSVSNPLGGEINLQLLSRLSRLDWSPDGILLGLSSTFDGPANVALNSPGSPLLPESPLPFPNGDAVGASVKLSLLNQALHQLWRAGFFNLEGEGLVDGLGAELPSGVEVTLNIAYPPFVEGEDGASRVSVALGPLTAGVRYPGFFEEPFPLQLVARLSAGVELIGERELSFSDVQIDEIVFSLGSSVPAASRQLLEEALRATLQRLVDEALNSALPVLPLPELTLPSGFEAFDLPPTTRLGLRAPTLTGDRGLWRLSGDFGEP